jgi:tRNA threonylcarbamoyladenosine biosynthesis protein TsaB
VSTQQSYPIILAIESSTPLCSVALSCDGVVTVQRQIGMGIHSTSLFTQIKSLLDQAHRSFKDVDAIVVGMGPGSYTGLRVSASAIKGLLFRSSKPLLGANTLAGFAACASGRHSGVIHSIIDARRNHVYYQQFVVEAGFVQPSQTVPVLVEIPAIYTKIQPTDMIVGSGIERLDPSQVTSTAVLPLNSLDATGLLRLVLQQEATKWVTHLDASTFEPTYSVPEDHTQ